MRILLAEDERTLSEALVTILSHSGYSVDAVYDGRDAYDYLTAGNYDCAVLDIMMPKMDGITVLKKIRAEGITIPVMMLTAKSETDDKVEGLDSGADDYMTKPFDTEELLARVGALTRRTGEVIIDKMSFADLTLKLNSAVLSCADESVQLSRKEFEVLKIFLYNPSMTIGTEALISKVWGMDSEATDNNVEVYVSFLRKKLKYLGSRVSIKKIHKIGYRLEVE
jgi:DNA-binding response OmpR family regulator